MKNSNRWKGGLHYRGPVRVKSDKQCGPGTATQARQDEMATNDIKIGLNTDRDMAYPSKCETTIF